MAPIPSSAYATTPIRELLESAARGHLALDHRVLHVLLDNPERSLPDIVEFTSRQWSEDRINLEEDLILIARHLQSAELSPFLLDRVKADPFEVPDLLQEAVCEYGAKVLDGLLELHDTIEEVHTSEVPFLLAMLGVEDKRIRARFESLADKDPEESAFCLQIYEAPAAEEPPEEAFDIWREFPDHDQPDFENLPEAELMEFLESPHAELRRQAAEGFEPDRPISAAISDKLLQLAREDEDAWVRGAAWRALVLLELDEGRREQMVERLVEPSTAPGERAGLAVALAMVERDGRITRSIRELYESEETRTHALEAMWRTMDPVFSSTIVGHLDDTDSERRENAILGVGHLGIKGALSRIEALFNSDEFRSSALVAYAMATPSKVSPAYMRRVFKKVEEIAGGLDSEEAELVRMALDNRLRLHGHAPMFEVDGDG